jgi:Fic family protein
MVKETNPGRMPTTSWQARTLPEPGWPAGYSALIEDYGLQVPPPPRLALVAKRHKPDPGREWLVLPQRRRPADTLKGHLEFALKHEGVSLSVLNALFDALPAGDLAELVLAAPTGIYTRRLWFLYEWLTGRTLDVPDAGTVRAIEALDPTQQVALKTGALSKRHRVYDNLPGTPAFCPMVRWSEDLKRSGSKRLDERAKDLLSRTPPDVIGRAAAFLLISDSQSSFQIEGERPGRDRIMRWGRAIAHAGSNQLSVDELVRLQRVLIGDARFVALGLREEGGYVGMHDRHTHEPLPEHISARPEDLRDLLDGIIVYEKRATLAGIDPVIAAAVVAFGFVYVHPFVDGNGRIHRWLIHHVLARAGYNPPGLVFPVSAAILREIERYRKILESYSQPLLEFIEWEPTERRNLRVLNDTADYYRYLDATPHAEFLYRCAEETVERDLPEEVAFLEGYDRFAIRAQEIVDLPATTVELLHKFLRQGNGKLSKRARTREFAALTGKEAEQIEQLYTECCVPTRSP